MNDKKQIQKMLKEEFSRWEELLAGMSEEQITGLHLPSTLTVKDVIAHLWAWQQRSVARMEAALHNREPRFPRWPETLEPESGDDLDQLNAWIYETYRGKPWSSVYGDWREGFLRFLELGEQIPEKDLLEPGRYAWLEGQALSLIPLSSYEHHEEHLEPLLAWLRQKKSRDLVITRLFDAPLELVWKAWTDPKHVMRWWGPDGFTSPACEMDFREGGRTLVCMRAPKEFGGQDMYSTWVYTEIVPMQRIEYIQNLADKDGKRVDPAQVGMPADFPQDVRTVVTFKALGGKTEMTITEFGLPDADTQMGKYAEIGLNQSLDKMAASFAKR